MFYWSKAGSELLKGVRFIGAKAMADTFDWEEFGRLERATCSSETLQCLKRLSAQVELGLCPGRFLTVGEKLLNCTKENLFDKLSPQEQIQYFDIFLKANPTDVMLLLSSVSPSVDPFVAKLVSRALDVFFRNGLSILLVTLVDTEQRICQSSSFGALCQAFVRIPDRLVAVSSHKVASSKLTAYFRAISVALIKAFAETLSRFKNHQDSSLEFHSLLIGKLSITGYGKDVLRTVVPYLLARTRSEEGILWSRVARRIIIGVPEISQERVLLDTLELVTTGDSLYRLIGDAVVTEKRLKLLLTKKLLFVRCFESSTVPKTIFKYLSMQNKNEGQEMIKAAFLESLDVWSSPSAICLSPIAQRLYLGIVQLLSLRYMAKDTLASVKDDALQKSMKALANHLASPRDDIQTLGKVVFQYVSKCLQPEQENINFPYNASPLVDALQEVMKDEQEGDSSFARDDQTLLDFEFEEEPSSANGEAETCIADSGEVDPEVNDRSFPQLSYIEECIDLLWDSKEYEQFVGALCSLERLIRRKTPGSHDLAVEVVRLLVHLDKRFHFEKFDETRVQCMVACCVKEPIEVAACLCEEVFNKETVILRKMDILRALQLASCELAWGPSAVKLNLTTDSSSLDGLQCILAASRRSGNAKATENRFAAISPKFFYPLFFGWMSLKMDGDDYQTFLRIGETLCTFLVFSGQSVYVTSMASSLIRTLWPLHGHSEPAVRAMVLSAFLVASEVVPEKVLATEMHRDLPDIQKWVDLACITDSDGCCRNLASAVQQRIGILKRRATTLSLSSKLLLQ
ncbi:TWiK family of potassium channels protein 9 [Trichuris trichiura]|uniref:TWiK family of potassium channels protein 9 n=1 Tax=Trichuris trichiura TaxID=36087 RepID=A0A077Z264_TRITR|nr:TWiK family of potassium channels protein 9 [Trichuris trichiura]